MNYVCMDMKYTPETGWINRLSLLNGPGQAPCPPKNKKGLEWGVYIIPKDTKHQIKSGEDHDMA